MIGQQRSRTRTRGRLLTYGRGGVDVRQTWAPRVSSSPRHGGGAACKLTPRHGFQQPQVRHGVASGRNVRVPRIESRFGRPIGVGLCKWAERNVAGGRRGGTGDTPARWWALAHVAKTHQLPLRRVGSESQILAAWSWRQAALSPSRVLVGCKTNLQTSMLTVVGIAALSLF